MLSHKLGSNIGSYARDVASRSGHRCRKAPRHRISGHGDNWYLGTRRLQMLRETCRDDVNHVWPGLSHLLSQGRKALRLARRSPSINPDRFALDVAEPRQFIEECSIALAQARGPRHYLNGLKRMHHSQHWQLALLGCRSKRER